MVLDNCFFGVLDKLVERREAFAVILRKTVDRQAHTLQIL